MMSPEPNRPRLQPQELQPNPVPSKSPNTYITPTDSNLPASGRRQTSPSGGGNSGQQSNRVGLGVAAKLGIFAAGLVACLALGNQFLFQPAVEEKAHKNWTYVQMATDQTLAANGETRIVLLGPDKQPKIASSMGMGEKQKDDSTTKSVLDAVKQGSTREAVSAILAAQKIPDVPNPATNPATGEKLVPKIAAPTITAGMKQELMSGDINFFHLYLYDCCAEDGDVVDVLLDGQFFARVPITHAGATLSIPMVAGRVTALAVQGVHDGGGGITIAFGSSGGDAFLGVLDVGQTVPLGVVGK